MRRMANGTAVACDGKAVLILGEPGVGKSDLALRLIDQGAALIADDLVELTRGADGLPGFRTRRSIGDWQAKNGMAPTCFPSAALVKSLGG